ncbi:hemagglutinin/amebocyte aggregation factor-like [Physella acuta]|uniref:hemagglutinin/amebocyte aggregation factor-like n=1 Tax=Physella acuta TaxID=109671 RepID=UPI0027DDA35E|nr:hemagglutinin/amebocyte aggregation factor-like [Physella acuta]
MTPLLKTLLLLACLSSAHALTSMTNVTEDWSFTCTDNQALLLLESAFEENPTLGEADDRVWNFTCGDVPALLETPLTDCEWTFDVNDYTSYFEFQCYNDEIVTGVSSTYDVNSRDRKFRFQCCKPGNYVTHACQYSDFVNKAQEDLTYAVPDGFVLRGVSSLYVASGRDRLFKFDVCKLALLFDPVVIIG